MLNTALTLVIFGLVIGANNLTVALALGAIGQRRKQGRILLVFGWIGLQVGHRVKQDYEKAGNIAAGLLLIVLAGAVLFGWI